MVSSDGAPTAPDQEVLAIAQVNRFLRIVAPLLLGAAAVAQSGGVRVDAPRLGLEARSSIERVARRALAVAERRLDRDLGQTVTVHVVRSTAELPEAMRRSWNPWTVALARTHGYEVWVVRRRIRLEPPDDWSSVLVHEFVHVCLGDRELELSGGQRRIPTWLHEGLAQHLAGSLYLSGSEEAVWFRARTGRLLRWSDLEDGFPRTEDEARLAYAQAASFVDFLDREVGLGAVLAAIDDYLTGKSSSLDEAMWSRHWGQSFTHLTGAWVREISSGRGLLRWLDRNCFSFLVILAVPLLAIVLYKRLRREQRAGARLEAFEQEAYADEEGESE